MPKIAVQPSADEQSLPAEWTTRLEERLAQCRHKAYELFERAGKPEGLHLDHWMEAEHLLLSGNGQIKDLSEAFEVQISVPGFVAKEIEVRALPHMLLVCAETKLMDPSEEGTQMMLQRYFLPEPIDTAEVTAHLEKGTLHIVARKTSAPKTDAPQKLLTSAATA